MFLFLSFSEWKHWKSILQWYWRHLRGIPSESKDSAAVWADKLCSCGEPRCQVRDPSKLVNSNRCYLNTFWDFPHKLKWFYMQIQKTVLDSLFIFPPFFSSSSSSSSFLAAVIFVLSLWIFLLWQLFMLVSLLLWFIHYLYPNAKNTVIFKKNSAAQKDYLRNIFFKTIYMQRDRQPAL